MKKKRIMILGCRESGKTTLANHLNDLDTAPKRTPHMVYGKNTLDVPGSYLESPWMHKHLIAAQQDAFCVLMLCTPLAAKRSYPPGFSKVFRIPVIGVITKSDLGPEGTDRCIAELQSAGIEELYYAISAHTGCGLTELTSVIDTIRIDSKKGVNNSIKQT